jgi:hypothetical protein
MPKKPRRDTKPTRAQVDLFGKRSAFIESSDPTPEVFIQSLGLIFCHHQKFRPQVYRYASSVSISSGYQKFWPDAGSSDNQVSCTVTASFWWWVFVPPPHLSLHLLLTYHGQTQPWAFTTLPLPPLANFWVIWARALSGWFISSISRALEASPGIDSHFLLWSLFLDGYVSPVECPLRVEHPRSFVSPYPWWRILSEHQSSFVGIGEARGSLW